MSVLSFGEPLLINYLESNKLTSASNSFFSLGGSEINTLLSLSNLGRKSYLISCLPENILGREYVEILKKNKINTDLIQRSDNEMFGTLYVKNNQVIYQRKNSAFTDINIYDVEFYKILNDEIKWLHLTGITPLLGFKPRVIWKELLRSAIEKDIRVSLDFNYREKLGFINELWGLVKPIIDKIEVFIISVEDLLQLCEIELIKVNEKSLEQTLLKFCEKLKIKKGLMSIKKNNNGKQLRRSVMVADNIIYSSNVKEHEPIDHIGIEDMFSAYIIDGLLNDIEIPSILNQADNFVIKNNMVHFNDKI